MDYKVYEFTFTVRSLGKTVDEAMDILKQVVEVNPQVLFQQEVEYTEVTPEQASIETVSLLAAGEA